MSVKNTIPNCISKQGKCVDCKYWGNCLKDEIIREHSVYAGRVSITKSCDTCSRRDDCLIQDEGRC